MQKKHSCRVSVKMSKPQMSDQKHIGILSNIFIVMDIRLKSGSQMTHKLFFLQVIMQPFLFAVSHDSDRTQLWLELFSSGAAVSPQLILTVM